MANGICERPGKLQSHNPSQSARLNSAHRLETGDEMKVSVVGAGGMGGVFGSLLSKSGHDVLLVDIDQEHVSAIQRRGLIFEDMEGDQEALHVSAVAPDRLEAEGFRGWADFAILFVKSYATREASLTVAEVLSPTGLAVTLQNGLGNDKILAEVLTSNRVIPGITLFGGTLRGPGHVAIMGVGKNYITVPPGCERAQIQLIADTLSRAGLTTVVADDALDMQWSKAVLNAGINAVSALTQLTNQELLDTPHAMAICDGAIEEAVAVAAAAGITLFWDDPIAAVRELLQSAPHERPSMQLDIRAGRRTEIQAINGSIASEGHLHGIPVPINDALTSLIVAVEMRLLDAV